MPLNSSVAHLGVQSGKDGQLRLLNLANLSGMGGPGHVAGEIGPVIGVPTRRRGDDTTRRVGKLLADASTRLFVVNGNGASSLKVNIDGSGNPSLAKQWQNGNAGSSPIIANGMVPYISGGNLRALDAISGSSLWSIANPGGMHWQSHDRCERRSLCGRQFRAI